MKIIGFANKYYTLWEVTSETCQYQAPNGSIYPSYMKYHYTYLQNISQDITKVVSLFPGVEIDLSLRGSHSFTIRKVEIDLTPEILKFGKYAGYHINELVKIDFDYVLYMINNFPERETWKLAQTTLEYINYIQAKEEAIKQKIAAIIPLVSGNHTFKIERNLDSGGDVFIAISDNHKLKLHWSNCKEFSYNGFSYFLPVGSNGKVKRIKNKELSYNIEITSTTTDERYGMCYQEANVIDVNF